MAEFFSSGRVVDFVIVLMALEIAILIGYRRRASRGPPVLDFLSCIVPGLMLMLALRCALVGVEWPWIALSLIAALLGHMADLRRRFSHATSISISRSKRR